MYYPFENRSSNDDALANTRVVKRLYDLNFSESFPRRCLHVGRPVEIAARQIVYTEWKTALYFHRPTYYWTLLLVVTESCSIRASLTRFRLSAFGAIVGSRPTRKTRRDNAKTLFFDFPQ